MKSNQSQNQSANSLRWRFQRQSIQRCRREINEMLALAQEFGDYYLKKSERKKLLKRLGL